ncbi:hypothetical protein C8F04DRAFT_1192177 [Mycena alexandri]|uniref:Uncharacterized protein n=1 Tax=Mycena alexandri TaxID=1745969 RepID=A0AAD6WTE0_9AGAR|nr:hypothetical protein C8F04DRAFT_1192177 [Mycena alexandri]
MGGDCVCWRTAVLDMTGYPIPLRHSSSITAPPNQASARATPSSTSGCSGLSMRRDPRKAHSGVSQEDGPALPHDAESKHGAEQVAVHPIMLLSSLARKRKRPEDDGDEEAQAAQEAAKAAEEAEESENEEEDSGLETDDGYMGSDGDYSD